MDTVTNDKDNNVTEEQVARYLRNHPGFFLEHEDLLAEIKLTHNSGHAVSLLERQVAILRERNRDMRHRLNNLLENAQRNDQLFEKTKALVLSLVEARRLEDVSERLTRRLTEDFDIDFAALTLFANPTELGGGKLRVSSLDYASERIGPMLRNSKAICGVLREEEKEFLFGVDSGAIGSAAVVPLYAGTPLGALAIGSRDPQHFRSSMGTLFIGYIGEVLNRVLPQHLRGKSA